MRARPQARQRRRVDRTRCRSDPPSGVRRRSARIPCEARPRIGRRTPRRLESEPDRPDRACGPRVGWVPSTPWGFKVSRNRDASRERNHFGARGFDAARPRFRGGVQERPDARLRFASLTFSFFFALLLAIPEADARERQGRARTGAAKSGHAERTVTRTRPDGTSRTSTHDSTWQRGDGKWTRDTVHTGPGGKQGTTHVEGAKTQDGRVRDVTRTGPGGKTATTHDEIHRTEGGYSRETTHTGPETAASPRAAPPALRPGDEDLDPRRDHHPTRRIHRDLAWRAHAHRGRLPAHDDPHGTSGHHHRGGRGGLGPRDEDLDAREGGDAPRRLHLEDRGDDAGRARRAGAGRVARAAASLRRVGLAVRDPGSCGDHEIRCRALPAPQVGLPVLLRHPVDEAFGSATHHVGKGLRVGHLDHVPIRDLGIGLRLQRVKL